MYNNNSEGEKIKAQKPSPPPPAAFKVGDRVRIFKKKRTFEKGFTPNWTEALFIVSEVRLTKSITYKIKDLKGEEIKGTFTNRSCKRRGKKFTESKKY